MATRFVLTRDQVRDLDRRAIEQYGLHSLVLMENAGRGCADILERQTISGPVLICCGKGNNGGDGFVLARHLDLRGYSVRVVTWDPPDSFSSDCRTNYEIALRGGLPIMQGSAEQPGEWQRVAEDCAWCVDALLGTGSCGNPRAPYDAAIRWINSLPMRRLAVDVPSGLDCDTGEPGEPTVRADITCTFVAAKPGLLVEQARSFVGTLHVADIGAPRKLIEEFLT